MAADQRVDDRVAEFLIEKFKDYRNKDRDTWNASQSDWADHLGVNNSTLSTWMLGRRVPSGDHVHVLAARLGPEIYDILGEPRRMPEDPLLRQTCEIVIGLNKENRKKVLDYAKSLREKAAAADLVT